MNERGEAIRSKIQPRREPESAERVGRGGNRGRDEGVGVIIDGLRGADDLDAVDDPAVRGGIVVKDADELPRGSGPVDGADELERLAREPAGADQQERLQGATPSTSRA
jgi:hypothetical protein